MELAFDGRVPPGTTRCFRIRGRTAGGTQGCVSQTFSAPVCVTVATPAIDQICKPYAVKAYQQVMTMGIRTGFQRLLR